MISTNKELWYGSPVNCYLHSVFRFTFDFWLGGKELFFFLCSQSTLNFTVIFLSLILFKFLLFHLYITRERQTMKNDRWDGTLIEFIKILRSGHFFRGHTHKTTNDF